MDFQKKLATNLDCQGSGFSQKISPYVLRKDRKQYKSSFDLFVLMNNTKNKKLEEKQKELNLFSNIKS